MIGKSSIPSIGSKWRYALVGGALSLPFTLTSYWQTGSGLSVAPVFFAGLLAGYLAKRRLGTARGVGARAGLIGGLPVLWLLADVLPYILGLPNPAWFTAVSVLAAVVTAILGIGLTALFGEIGGRLGSRLSGGSGQSGHVQSVN